jgi:Signal recognition particle 9 kDa protein (SRP9)
MPYLSNINSYLYQSSLLLQAYPTTTRITTKYSLPRERKPKTNKGESTAPQDAISDIAEDKKPVREQQPPSATLVFKTFETTAGICLKYETNKSAEVGRLFTGLGKLAKGETVEEPSAPTVGTEAKESTSANVIDVDAPPSQKVERVSEPTSSGGKVKRKKGKK